MNTRLKKTFGWHTGLVYQGKFLVNHYSIECSMLTVTNDNKEQNIAYDRMKYWMYGCMDDAILISENDPVLAQYQALDQRLIVFPDEPVDQIVGIMLYLKLNAIMENRMVVTDVEIWSKHGDNMSYMHSAGESVGDKLCHDGWWSDSRPIWTTSRRGDNQVKVVSLDRLSEWSDHDLGWDYQDNDSNTVVFAKFNKDENK